MNTGAEQKSSEFGANLADALPLRSGHGLYRQIAPRSIGLGPRPGTCTGCLLREQIDSAKSGGGAERAGIAPFPQHAGPSHAVIASSYLSHAEDGGQWPPHGP